MTGDNGSGDHTKQDSAVYILAVLFESHPFVGVVFLIGLVGLCIQRTFNKTAEYRGVEPITWFERAD